MSKLRCSNPECESRKNEESCQEPFFNVNVTVYGNRSLAENLHKLDVGQFECGMCGAKAEEKKDFDVQVHASEEDKKAGRMNVDITVDPDSPLYDGLSEEDRDPECDEDCARGGPQNCNGCMD